MSRLPDLPVRKTPVIESSITVFGPVRQPSQKLFPRRARCAGFDPHGIFFLDFTSPTPVVKSIKQRDLLSALN
jgi:hypothetical protein